MIIVFAGYMEWSTIHDDVCVLTITGTAATVRGLPDLAQAQRMWAEWELHQSGAIGEVGEKHGGVGIGIGSGGVGRRGVVRNAYVTGDSSPGSVISTNPETPFSDAPFSGAESDNGGERGHDDEAAEGGDVVNGHLHMDGSPTRHIPFSNLSRREIKDARMTRNAQRLERRIRRLGVGKSGNRRSREHGAVMDISPRDRYIDQSGFVSVLSTARLARPCSYCHVPYHHRLAPFTNMKLVYVWMKCCAIHPLFTTVSCCTCTRHLPYSVAFQALCLVRQKVGARDNPGHYRGTFAAFSSRSSFVIVNCYFTHTN